MAEPDVAKLLDSLMTADLGFVVIGGLAARAWGVGGHRKDVDIVLDPRPAHLGRVAQLIVRLNGHADRGGMCARSSASIASALLSGRRVLFDTELGPLDVVNRVEGVPSYEALRRDAVSRCVYGVRVPVCSLAHLRLMKGIADRESDREDLERLDSVTSYPGRRALTAIFALGSISLR